MCATSMFGFLNFKNFLVRARF